VSEEHDSEEEQDVEDSNRLGIDLTRFVKRKAITKLESSLSDRLY